MTPGEGIRNYYRNQGAELERERIIKLLKEYWTESNRTWIPIHEAIALIKGEQK